MFSDVRTYLDIHAVHLVPNILTSVIHLLPALLKKDRDNSGCLVSVEVQMDIPLKGHVR